MTQVKELPHAFRLSPLQLTALSYDALSKQFAAVRTSMSLMGGKKYKREESRNSYLSLSLSLWIPFILFDHLSPLAALNVTRFILLCYSVVYALLCSWSKCRGMRCFMFFFSENVCLLKASYFSIPVKSL